MTYQKVWPVKFNKFEVTKNGKVGIADRTNKILVPIRYKYINIEGETITATLPDGTKEIYNLKILYP